MFARPSGRRLGGPTLFKDHQGWNASTAVKSTLAVTSRSGNDFAFFAAEVEFTLAFDPDELSTVWFISPCALCTCTADAVSTAATVTDVGKAWVVDTCELLVLLCTFASTCL